MSNRIEHAVALLLKIEDAALRAPMAYGVNGSAEVVQREQGRIDNAVRIYCALHVGAEVSEVEGAVRASGGNS